jgi:hypothetical protein
MRGSWNEGRTHYRCRYPAEYGLANRIQTNRRTSELFDELTPSRRRRRESPILGTRVADTCLWGRDDAPQTATPHEHRSNAPDQAPIESFFGHIKTEWPHLTVIGDAAELETELERMRTEYNAAGCAAIRGPAGRRQGRRGWGDHEAFPPFLLS